MLYNDALITTLWGDQLLAMARTLAANRDFFELSASLRQEKVSHLSLWLQPYLVNASEQDFLEDAQNIFAGSTQRTGLVQVLLDYYLNDFILLVDELPDLFGSCSLEEKVKVVDGMQISPVEAEILTTYSISQIELSVENLFRRFAFPGECVLVESPMPVDSQMKKTIRRKYAGDVVFFHVKPNLLGGVRVLKNGLVLDYSWSESINRIAQKLNVL